MPLSPKRTGGVHYERKGISRPPDGARHVQHGLRREGETLPESSGAAFNGLVDGAGEFPLWEVDSRK